MQITLNVLLYQLSANSIYESQNVDLSRAYDGIKLFDADFIPESDKKYLYLVSAKTLRNDATGFLCQQILSTSVFLCVCHDEQLHLDAFPRDLSMVLLYMNDSFPVIFNRILNIFDRFAQWEKNFHLMLLQQKPLQDLLDLSRNFLVHPMVVLDRNYSLLGYLTHPDSSDPIMESILSAGYVTPEIMLRLRQDGLISPSENAENPLINWYCLTSHDCYYSMMYRYTANNHTVGYAIVFRCRVHPKTNYLYLMNMISENLQLYFQQERFVSRSSSEIYESVFTEILEHPDVPKRQYEDQISYIPNLQMDGRFLLARVSYTNQAELPFSFVCWNLKNAIPQLSPFNYRNNLYILKNNTNAEDYACFLTDEEEAIFCKNFRGHSFTCGISSTFFSLMDLPTAVSQCAEALQLGPQINETGNNNFYRFEDIYIHYILRELRKSTPMKMLSSPCYTLLKQYDEKKGSDLCDVFMHFLKNGRSINQTSAAIFLHRNTVLNKVKKAASIMQNECEDYQTRLAFMLAYLEDHVT